MGDLAKDTPKKELAYAPFSEEPVPGMPLANLLARGVKHAKSGKYLLLCPQQLFHGNSQGLCCFDDDIPPGEFSGPFPICPSRLRDADDLAQCVLRQALFRAEVVKPGSVWITAGFRFSAHKRIINGRKKVVAYYQYIGNNCLNNK